MQPARSESSTIEFERPPLPFDTERMKAEIQSKLAFHRIPPNLRIVLRPRVVWDVRVELRDGGRTDALAMEEVARSMVESVTAIFDGVGRRMPRKADEIP